MQIEIYKMAADSENLMITLEAVWDSFSSLLWDIEYYSCGTFEVYIATNPRNIEVFQTGRIVGRDDDKEHFGIIESVKIETDAENGDYLTVSGRFLICLLERRIIYPTCSFTSQKSYSDIVHAVVSQNAVSNDNRKIPGLSLGSVSGDCWGQTTKLQVSYDNLMEWIYSICEKIGGTANIRLKKISGEQYEMILDLSEGTDRSVLQAENPHIIFLTDTQICYRSHILLTFLNSVILPMYWERARVQSVNEQRTLTVTSRLFYSVMKSTLTQRIWLTNSRKTVKQSQFPKMSISNF